MSFDVGAILGRMVLDTEKWDKAVAQVQMQTKTLTQKTKELGAEWAKSGKKLDQLGNKLTMIGALGLAPFALAVKGAAKENLYLQNRLDQMGDSFLRISESLATNVVPWVDRLNNAIKGAAVSFDKLNPSLRQFLVDLTIVASVLTLSGGLILKTVGLLTILTSAVTKAAAAVMGFAAANPFVAIAAGVTALVYLFMNFKEQILKVNEALGITIAYGIVALTQAVQFSVLRIITFIMDLIAIIPRLPKAIKDAVANMEAPLLQMYDHLVADFEATLDYIGEAWSGFFDKTEEQVVKSGGVWSEVMAGMQKGVHDLQKTYSNWGEFAKMKTMEIAQAMESYFSNYFFNLMQGKFESFKETMASLGRAILQMIADIIARMLVALAIKAILAPVTGGASFLIPSHQDGAEEIPSTGLYRLHSGEKVTPKYDASGAGDGKISLTIHNVITPEAIAAAMTSKEGRGVIINTINADSMRNGVTRREVMKR